MDELLGGLRQEGQLDSQGTFTLSLQEATRKLAERQFELPGLYLLKLIQAAVAFRARSIEIKITASTVSFNADLPESPPQVERVLRGPFQEFPHPGLMHLAWAWAALAAVHPPRAALQTGGHRLELCEGTVTVTEQVGARLQVRLEKGAVRWWQRLLPGRTAEHALVGRAAGYCPVPLKLDGRAVDGSEPRLGHWTRGKLKILTTALWQPVTRDFLVGQRMVLRPGGGVSGRPPLLAEPGSVFYQTSEILTGFAFNTQPCAYSWKLPETVEPICVRGPFRREYQRLEGAYLLGFHSGYEENEFDPERLAFLALPWASVDPYLSPGSRRVSRFLPSMGFTVGPEQRVPVGWAQLWLPADQPDEAGWLYPCQHGVLLDPVRRDLGYAGAVVVVTADDLATDLSQLRVVEDQRLEKLVEEVRAEVLEFRAELAQSKGVSQLSQVDYLVMSHLQRRLGS